MDVIASVSVFRLNGEAVRPDALSATGFIDTKGWGNGIYIVKITTKEGWSVSKKVSVFD